MNTLKSTFFQLIKRKELLLFLILIIAGISLSGWLSGKMGLASVSLKYIPIAHSSTVVFIALSILFFINIDLEKSGLIRSLVTLSVIIIAFYCGLILLDFIFDFAWDAENNFIRNPEKFGNVLIGRMSPISSLLFIFICAGILGIKQNKFNIIKYSGGSLSLLTALISSVLLIGYLYNAPLLYGSQIIPVSLPSAICFLLFSITLLRSLELKYWTFNMIKDNKVTRQLLKSFLPIVVFMVILQGYLDTVLSFNDINPPLTSALILLIVISITFLIVLRISGIIGAQIVRAEQKLKESEKQLQQLNTDKDLFISILSHDMRTPFTVILGYSELLLNNIHKTDINQIENFANNINTAAQNTFILLEDILMWARTQQGRIPFQPQKLNFADICKKILEIHDQKAESKNITINLNAPDGMNIFADADMLKTVLRNLVSNAIKFTNKNGTINISAAEDSKNVTISVADNGIGIDPESLTRLFDISQNHTTRDLSGEKGTGLGLVLCKEFIEKHGGKIWVESEQGKGSKFIFTMPVFTGQTL